MISYVSTRYYRAPEIMRTWQKYDVAVDIWSMGCVDGKVLLETKSRVAVAPDGNGGLYATLHTPPSLNDKTRTVLSDFESRKVLYVYAYCVNNCLVRVTDPIFVGYGISKQADCAAKVVPKAYPTESVGIVAKRDGKYNVVEYSEISTAQAEARDTTTGKLSSTQATSRTTRWLSFGA